MTMVMFYGRFLPSVPNDNQSKWCGFLLAVEMTIVTKKRRKESVGGVAAHTPFIINILWSSFRPKGGIHNSLPPAAPPSLFSKRRGPGDELVSFSGF